jgi:hypothetical protein
VLQLLEGKVSEVFLSMLKRPRKKRWPTFSLRIFIFAINFLKYP